MCSSDLFIPFSNCYSQDKWGSSISVELSKRIIKGLNVSFEEDFRLRDDFKTVDRFSSTLELSYKPITYLKIGGAYNLMYYQHEKRGWEYRQRYYFYATGMYKIDRFRFSIRERFQSTYRNGVKETAKRANPKLYLRSRFEVEYDIRKSKFAPFASVEMFNTLNDLTVTVIICLIIFLGLEYIFIKNI